MTGVQTCALPISGSDLATAGAWVESCSRTACASSGDETSTSSGLIGSDPSIRAREVIRDEGTACEGWLRARMLLLTSGVLAASLPDYLKVCIKRHMV